MEKNVKERKSERIVGGRENTGGDKDGQKINCIVVWYDVSIAVLHVAASVCK